MSSCAYCRRIWILALVFAALWTRPSRADVNLIEKDDWTVFTRGRVNAFVSFGTGDAYPLPKGDYALVNGAGFQTVQYTEDNKYVGTRVRSGFVGNVLGFGLTRKLNPVTTLKAYLGYWTTIETQGRVKWQPVDVDAREGYLQLETPYGNLLAGRSLGIFGRGSAEIDYEYGHGFGVGSPCSLDSTGPACGHIGYGVLYPGFAPGFVYDTPRFSGLGLSVGIYDPVSLAGTDWYRAPYPRTEGEISFLMPWETGLVKLSASAVWQRLGYAGLDRTTDVTGVSGAARLELGIFKLGLHAFSGKGVGMYYALENSPANFVFNPDNELNAELRSADGAYAQIAITPGPLHFALGAGMARIHLTDWERTTVVPDSDPPVYYSQTYSVPKQQLGLSAAVYYHITDYFVYGLDVFRATTEWYLGEEQTLLFVNTGPTLHW